MRPLAGVSTLWIAVAARFVCTVIAFQQAWAANMVLVHARVYASPGVSPLDDATIVLRAGRIASISRAGAVPREATVLDCSGMSVTARSWNSHMHILPVKFLHAAHKSGAELTEAFQEMLTAWGFTSVLDVGSVLANTKNIRRRIEAEEILGPRILTTGEPFFPTNGVPAYVKGYLEGNRISLRDDASTSAAVERVRVEVHEGADAIKILAGSIQAHSVLMLVAGSDSPHQAKKMAVIPTLMLFDVEAKKSGYSPDDAQKFEDIAAARLRVFNAAGREILFGTDVAYIYQFDTTEEYTLMQRAGMSFAQVLSSLTTNSAEGFGYDDHSGLVREGMDGDLTVLRGDPGSDIAAFSRVRNTIRGGKVIFGEAPTDAAK